MIEENGKGAAAKVERRILADVALWLIPILLVGIFGFVWSINSKVTDLELRIVRLETMQCMAKAARAPAPKPARKGWAEAQAAAPADKATP